MHVSQEENVYMIMILRERYKSQKNLLLHASDRAPPHIQTGDKTCCNFYTLCSSKIQTSN